MTENIDPVTAQGTIYADECDHMGHFNVAAYTRRFDEATWAMWSGLGLSVEVMERDRIGIAALESRLTYHKELFPGQTIRTRSRVITLGGKTAGFHHRMYLVEDRDGAEVETLSATCTYTVACLDRTARKARVWPDEIAARVKARVRPLEEGAPA
ncbi:acyl-CoA thioesterase [Rhodospirillaceae bacterium KN72]|uniref:Acyl-CoA thioesterase n=1 Tax=Pacificispira spongiicola TaxID=2729598 RepID=A0A7Y0E3L3_9PROT|nr:thioesterase family protein [Pacificispira spongiicola]NMM46632.1 acyl-CoA thioesterase [Pacificispira spongiicola]